MTQAELEAALREAWTIICVLTAMDNERGEPWPRALDWLAEHDKFQNQPK